MKLYIYDAHGDLVGLQIRKDPIPDDELEESMGEDGEAEWRLVGTMEVSSLEGKDLVEAFEMHGCISASANFGTFWNI